MLSGLNAHTTANILSATMAHVLLGEESRFTFSHEFDNIPLQHLMDWYDKNFDELTFRLRTIRNENDNYESVQDLFINDIIYRPTELESICVYEQIQDFKKQKISKNKKKKSTSCNSHDNDEYEEDSHNIESKDTFNFS